MKRLVHTPPSLKRISLQTALKASTGVPLMKNNSQLNLNSKPSVSLNLSTKTQSFHTNISMESQDQEHTNGKKPSAEIACRLHTLVRAYRSFGHHEAQLDPLGLQKSKPHLLELKPSMYFYDLEDKSYEETQFEVDGIVFMGQYPKTRKFAKMDEIVHHLRKTYCGSIAAQFMHIDSTKEQQWIARQLELSMYNNLSAEQLKRTHQLLLESEVFDHFLAKKFPSLKRYGLEGGETFIPALEQLMFSLNQQGVSDIVIGMPHRGRLNFLTGLLHYPPRALFHKIKGNLEFPPETPATGDVISHIGISSEFSYGHANKLRVSLLNNPSHLEAVNPVALGKAKAKQSQGKNAAAVIIHGDAAFSGQGIVHETFLLSNLPHFGTGGTVHIILNNQLGFTTSPEFYRSNKYSGDVGKMISTPIFSVNAESIEDVSRVMNLAVEFRQKFKKDVIVELVCYRRHGHNELDEAAFTQPIMYSHIRKRKTFPTMFGEDLLERSLITTETIESIKKQREAFLEAEFKASDSYVPEKRFLHGDWEEIKLAGDISVFPTPKTGTDTELLKRIAIQSVTLPDTFTPHPRLKSFHIDKRVEMINNGAPIDWATAEAMAVGSLLYEGYCVRLSGQDVGRGTFSQRHFELVDQNTEKRFIPLQYIEGRNKEKNLTVVASPLSELGVLGFEYGYSLNHPLNLILWEAQYGDFVNGSQIILDTFISSGEEKWALLSAITLLLPHGMDGTGAEHSSCRLERFLQACDGDINTDEKVQKKVNMFVINPTTPANYFHALRRQMYHKFRKPLIVVGPKTLLRHPRAVSPLSQLAEGTQFESVLPDAIVKPCATVKRIILCTGKVYYELEHIRAEKKLEDKVAIIRLEELSPFPYLRVEEEVMKYVNAGAKIESLVWMQEEHENSGAYIYAAPRLQFLIEALGLSKLTYVGRRASAVPAVGNAKAHKQEVQEIFTNAFANL